MFCSICICVYLHYFIYLYVQLSGTHDPIADFINAVQSDMVAFASQRTLVHMFCMCVRLCCVFLNNLRVKK